MHHAGEGTHHAVRDAPCAPQMGHGGAQRTVHLHTVRLIGFRAAALTNAARMDDGDGMSPIVVEVPFYGVLSAHPTPTTRPVPGSRYA